MIGASSRLRGRNKGSTNRKEKSNPARPRRSVSFPTSFPSRSSNKDRTQLRKAGSLQVDDFLDESTDDSDSKEGSVQSLAHLTDNVTVSVHNETQSNAISPEFISEGVVDEEVDTGISCCAFDLYDSFFFQPPEEPECRKQRSGSSSSSTSLCDEVTTRIECILQEEYEEGKKEFSLAENEDDLIIPPQIQISVPSQVSLPHTSEWKQYPLLLTATPNAGMTIRGIRRLCDPSFFDNPVNDDNMNGGLMQLPINNGKEPLRHSWVIDFETELFAGTAMFRIRDCNTGALTAATAGLESKEKSDHDYFRGKNRKYQVVIRGRFKQEVVMASCLSGLLLDKPLATSGKSSSHAPPKWILRAAVRVANIFSPRMDADLECENPRVLSPLCSTAQTIRRHLDNDAPVYHDEPHNEPHPDSTASLACILKKRSSYDKNTNYDQYRKRVFNSIYDDYMASAGSKPSPHFDDAEYTFEFLQHLVDYNELSLDLGRAMGKMKLGAGLRGQPVRIAALSNPRDEQGGLSVPVLSAQTCLWSFDLWHASNVCTEIPTPNCLCVAKLPVCSQTACV